MYGNKMIGFDYSSCTVHGNRLQNTRPTYEDIYIYPRVMKIDTHVKIVESINSVGVKRELSRREQTSRHAAVYTATLCQFVI